MIVAIALVISFVIVFVITLDTSLGLALGLALVSYGFVVPHGVAVSVMEAL